MLPSLAPLTRKRIASSESAWPSRFSRIRSSAVTPSSLIWPDVAHIAGAGRDGAALNYFTRYELTPGAGANRQLYWTSRAGEPGPSVPEGHAAGLPTALPSTRSEERRVG